MREHVEPEHHHAAATPQRAETEEMGGLHAIPPSALTLERAVRLIEASAPAEHNRLFTVLHSLKGNAFVQQVIAAMSPERAASVNANNGGEPAAAAPSAASAERDAKPATSTEQQGEEQQHDHVMSELSALSTPHGDHGHDHDHEEHAHDVGEPAETEMPHPPAPTSERATRPQRAAAPRATSGDVLRAAEERMLCGVRIYAPAGTHMSAVAQAGGIITKLVGRNPVAQQRLAMARATIVIIPARTKMTDLPQFAALKGKRTFDNRDWSSVRGSGGMQAADGSFAIGVAEENLIAIPGVRTKYAYGYVGMHELAHTIESKGMTDEQRLRLTQLYQQQRMHDARDFTDAYAATDVHEYFANSTNAFFGTNAYQAKRGVPIKGNSREWLQTRDPDMYAFLVEMYDGRASRG